jgi:hypothetical protein
VHDPLAVAALFGYESVVYEEDGDRYEVSVLAYGAHSPQDAVRGQVGRTVAKKAETGAGEKIEGVRIPRKLHTHKFWDVLEQCAKAADEKSGGQVSKLTK